ncbi:hypothetical protein MPER_08676 [Moniliophthora perniciosa FA553]|nr:hypothetical protein MPER_08676 [Moniliophthora perniciosa FA553]
MDIDQRGTLSLTRGLIVTKAKVVFLLTFHWCKHHSYINTDIDLDLDIDLDIEPDCRQLY